MRKHDFRFNRRSPCGWRQYTFGQSNVDFWRLKTLLGLIPNKAKSCSRKSFMW